MPWLNRSMKIAWLNARYSSESVRYVWEKSAVIPIRFAISRIPSPNAVISSRHFSMNDSRSHSWRGFPYFFSTVRSMLIPFRSRPKGNTTALPSIRWERAIMSMREYATTAPGCQSPLGYGGGVSITYVDPRSGSYAVSPGSDSHTFSRSLSNWRSHCFALSFGSGIDDGGLEGTGD